MDIFTGVFKSSVSTVKVSAVVFQSQYFNTTNDRYQTKVLTRVYKGDKKFNYESMDAYEAQFYNKTIRKIYMRQEDKTLIPYMFIYSAVNVSIGNFLYVYKGYENFTGFNLETAGYIRDYPFRRLNETFAIKTPNRFYLLGRGVGATLQKAEYNFSKKQWSIPDFEKKKVIYLNMISENQLMGIKCSQQEELGDTATCLAYTGDGANYVLLYDPGDINVTPQGRIAGTRLITIPPSTDRFYEDKINTFKITNNLIIKSTFNRRREFQVTYLQQGKEIQDPSIDSYDGFMVWDLTRKARWPVIRKYFPSHFTDFTLAGDLIWTCSPQDEPSTVFNLSLGTNITTQVLSVPDVEYLRAYFDNMFLKADFLNGTVIKIPFNQIFSLPSKNTSAYIYIITGVLVLILVLFCVCCKTQNKRKAMGEEIQKIEKRKTMSKEKVKQFIPEKEDRDNSSALDFSRFKSTVHNPTTITDETSQDVML